MIKVSLYMAMSINGLVNDPQGKTPWCEAEWERYGNILRRTGCLIVGRHTHTIMTASGEYKKLSVNRVVVLTKNKIDQSPGITSVSTPGEALDQLADEGFKEVIVGGGTATNTAFLTQNKIQEIYLDIEPVLFGQGLPLLNPIVGFSNKLQLLEIDRYAPNALGLRYTVIS